MSDASVPAARPARRRRWLQWIAVALAGLVALAAAALALLDSDIGHRFIAARIAALRLESGLRFEVGRIDGSIYGGAVLHDLRISDAKGLVFEAPLVRLDWHPFAWLDNRLDIDRLEAPRATWVRLPETRPSSKQGPILPGFDIRIGRLAIGALTVGPKITGVARTGALEGKADVRSGRAIVGLDARIDGSDALHVSLDSEPDRDRFDLDVSARGAAKGVLTKLAGLTKPLAVDVAGKGSWTHWDGGAHAEVGGTSVAKLALTNRAGRYALSGQAMPGVVLGTRVSELTRPALQVKGSAQLTGRRLDGTLALRSAALALDGQGALDFASNAFRDVRLRVRLLRPAALFSDMTGKDVELRAILDGPFASARFDYRLLAERMAFGQTGFEQVRAGGSGRLGGSPAHLPILFTAKRVTGVGDAAGGILSNLSVQGILDITAREISGNKLKLRSNKLQAELMLLLDLRNGAYQVGFAGGLNSYLIPGLGIVDVTTDLRILPGAGGKGTHIIGKGTAQVRRLDNGFWRSLAGGLPRIVTDLDQGADGVLHFSHAVLTAPDLRLAGSGARQRDGSFHIEASGTQSRYGPLTLVLDGPIDKPKVLLKLAHPDAGAGLHDVTVQLDPTPDGFAFKTGGESTLGSFTGSGTLLLPKGGTARIAVAALDVAGTRASGSLAIVDDGFDGSLAVDGGGLVGKLGFTPVHRIQQITGSLTADRASLEGVTIRQAQFDFTALLDPAGAQLNATLAAQGIRRGGMWLSRVAANANLRGGRGEVRASFAGASGRGFELQTDTIVAPDRLSIQAQGTVDHRPIALAAPAVLVRDGDGWRLQPARVDFSGGQAQIGGRFGGAIELDASLTHMPLSVLDVAAPGMALGGSATGTISYRDNAGVPSGRIDMTVRGLVRSGLIASSAPIDLGIAGVLQSDKAAFRAVMGSGGKTIGRAQALLTPLGRGDLVERLRKAPLVAQLRYDGPADTLWRLTGVELFALSGPVAIGADMRGTADAPQIQGSVRSDNGRIESAITGTTLTNVQLSGRFNGSRLDIDRFAAKDGKNGTVTGTGDFDFGVPHGLGIALSLDAHNAVMLNRDDIGATVTGPIKISSTGDGGTISGDLKLIASRYQFGKAAAAAAVPKLHVRELNRVTGAEEEEAAAPSPWQLDVHAVASNNLRVTGLGLNSEWSADLTIKGEPTAASILGRADLVRGSYEFAGREFSLSRGVIRFDGAAPINPALDIAATGDATGLSATIQISGTAARTQISFTSVPALPQDELLSRLLFGTSITNLSAPEALQLASAVAALNSGTGGLDPINAVRRATGLDRLRILPPDPTTGQGTAVAAGKYVTRRLYAEIVTDGQGYSATRVEFQVTRWLSLLASISTIGHQTATVKVSKDY